MLCPALKDLPPPPEGKTGWPWTEGSSQLPDIMPDGRSWPRVSIVTPSYNQGQFIEETIRSVLLQGYPDLEYLIIDGGSTDNSVEIIKKYEEWLVYWVSEPDKGQSHALNKGFEKARGDIIGWLNSDDLYSPCTLGRVAPLMWDKDKIIRPIVYGSLHVFDNSPKSVICKHVGQPADFNKLLAVWKGGGLLVPQAALFMAAYLPKKYPLNEHLHYIVDYELWLRLSQEVPFYAVGEEIFGAFRLHTKSKTVLVKGGWPFDWEIARISPYYWGKGTLSRWECQKKFWLEYMTRKYVAWPLLSFVRSNKNKLVNKIITLTGKDRYNKIKKFLRIYRGD